MLEDCPGLKRTKRFAKWQIYPQGDVNISESQTKNVNIRAGEETMGLEITCKEKKPEKRVSGLREWKKIDLIRETMRAINQSLKFRKDEIE